MVSQSPTRPLHTVPLFRITPFGARIRRLTIDELYDISAALCEVASTCERIGDAAFAGLADERYDAVDLELDTRLEHIASVEATRRRLAGKTGRR